MLRFTVRRVALSIAAPRRGSYRSSLTEAFPSSAAGMAASAVRMTSVMSAPAKSVLTNTVKEDPRVRLNKTRNMGIVAHIDAGKTTTTERILFYSGTQKVIGEVDRGTTTTDFLEEETQRGITITAAAVRLNWNDHSVNLIDTPGHVDFAIEVERSLRVLDGVVAVFDAAVGVQAQSYTVLRMAKRSKTPVIAFVNKMDKPTANHVKAVDSIRNKLKVHPLLLQIPLLSDSGEFLGVCDVVRMTSVVNQGKYGEQLLISEFDALAPHVRERLVVARHALIADLTSVDDEIATHFIEALDKFNGDEAQAELSMSSKVIDAAIRRQVLKGLTSFESIGGAHNLDANHVTMMPILFGAARRNVGVQALMDAVVRYLPSPLDRPNLIGLAQNGDAVPAPAPLAPVNVAFAFKVMFFADPSLKGELNPLVFFRVYAGTVEKGQKVRNNRSGETVTITKIFVMQGDRLTEVENLKSGAIGAVFSRQFATGDTIVGERKGMAHRKATTADDDAVAAFHSFEPIKPSTPVVSHAVESHQASDVGELKRVLANMALEDPTFTHRENEHGQVVVSAMGELHVEVMLSRMRRQFAVKCDLAKAIIEYAEGVSTPFTETIVLQHHGSAAMKLTVSLVSDLVSDELIPSDLVVKPETTVSTHITEEAEAELKSSVKLQMEGRANDGGPRASAADGSKAATTQLRALRFAVADAAIKIGKMGRLKLKMLGVRFVVTKAERIGEAMDQKELEAALIRSLTPMIAKYPDPSILEPIMDMTVTLSEDSYKQEVFQLLNERLAAHVAIDEEESGAGTVIRAVVPMRTITRFTGDLRKATKGNAHFWTTLRCFRPVDNADVKGRILQLLGFKG
jgi:elongation factor G